MKIAIIIPAYNEETAIKEVLLSLPKNIKSVSKIVSIVIDDGSTDKTYFVAKQHADYALRHIVNLGQGAAFSTGFAAAQKLDCDAVVTIDGDGQHCPADIEKILSPILKKSADVVSGSRVFKKSEMPMIRIAGNWLMNLVTYIVFRIWASDSQTGMRAFSRAALSKIKLYSMGHEVCSEIIGEVKRNNLKMKEVSIKTIYTDYSKAKGQSVFNAINIFTKILTIKLTGVKEK